MRFKTYILFFLIFIYQFCFSQVKYSSVSSGTWASSSTWDNGVPPNPLLEFDTIVISHDVYYNLNQVVHGVLIINPNGVITHNGSDLFIGKNVSNKGEFLNYGNASFNSILFQPDFCNAIDTKPIGHNFGTIILDNNLFIGSSCGSGFFYNHYNSNFSINNELNLSGYLCNEDTIVVTNLFRNNGGIVDCCGYIQTPQIIADQNNSNPAIFMCVNLCTFTGSNPFISVGGTNYSFMPPSDSVDLIVDDDSTLICNVNQIGDTINVCDASFGFSSSSFCLDGPNIIPSFVEDTLGYFSSSSSLQFIDSISGLINISSLDTGFYKIYHNLPSCIDSASFNLYSASFNYLNTIFCDSDTFASPLINGSIGGVFSSDLNSLINFQDSLTGEIDLINSYDTSYSIYYEVFGCLDTFSIDLYSNEFSYSNSSFCEGGVNPFPTISGNLGGLFSSNLPLSINSVSGEINLINALDSSYVIFYDILSCRDSFALDILSSNFNYDSSYYCMYDNNPIANINGTINGVFSSNAALDLDSNTGTINLLNSLDSNFIVYYQVGSCIDSSSVQLINTSFNYLDTVFCLDEQLDTLVFDGLNQGVFSINPNDITIDQNTGFINTSGAINSSYFVSHQIGGCQSTLSISIDDPSFSYLNSIYCSTDLPDSAMVVSNNPGFFTSDPAGLNFINSVSGLIDFSNSIDTIYSVIHSLNNCADTISLNVVSLANSIGSDDSICGLSTQIENLFDPDVNYLWSPLSLEMFLSSDTINNPLISVTLEGDYLLVCDVAKLGCIFKDTISLRFVDSISLDLGPDLIVNQSSIELMVNSNAAFYFWEELSVNQAEIQSPTDNFTTISNLITGDYLFRLTGSNDVCPEKYDEIALFVDWVFIPNGFSPNGDGINDFFGIDGTREGVDFEIQIVNRWGELVFASSDAFDKWNGTYNGLDIPEDTYFYFIDLAGFKYKGSVELRR